MVDFNDAGTMSKPPKDVVALIIIEKLYNYLEADEIFCKQKLGGAGGMTSIPRARLRNLFLLCRPMMERRLGSPEFDKVNIVCTDLEQQVDEKDLLECFIIIMSVLDKLELTKLDTKPVYNRARVEEANKVHGYG
jgi:hypothetical protein